MIRDVQGKQFSPAAGGDMIVCSPAPPPGIAAMAFRRIALFAVLLTTPAARRFRDHDRLLAVRHEHGEVHLWDVARGTRARQWLARDKADLLPAGHTFTDVALSPSGEQMAWLATPDRGVKEGRSVA